MKTAAKFKKPPPPLNETRLRTLALHYVGKYATTRSKLTAYLTRKIGERGWDGERFAEVEALVEQFTELGYVNDAQFAESRSRSFVARGFGKQRLDADLRAVGITESDASDAKEYMSESALQSAHNYARRKRIGPYAPEIAPPDRQYKQLQGFLRAGHDFELAKRFVRAGPGDEVSEE